jgi:hypothetical protein
MLGGEAVARSVRVRMRWDRLLAVMDVSHDCEGLDGRLTLVQILTFLSSLPDATLCPLQLHAMERTVLVCDPTTIGIGTPGGTC